MLNRHARVVAVSCLVALTVLAPQPAHAAGGFGNWDTNQPPPAATAGAGNGAVNAGATTEVTVSSGGSTTAGAPFSSTRSVPVPRRCW
ncbi:hypothetical protein [Cellulomonas sp. KH9]|uniref:hypothetical protein n=1 Tax=Cellulomonas sp. KH9 TaxID=1855324 RepID=UPI0008E49DD7|nr:hypothetical protein [Cellulomonas sp. KH9]SFK19119.1 hypothetical protein SAMN05216467_2416 [Cellulomonas sp. KH9]